MAQSDEIDLLELAIKLNRIFIKNLKGLVIAFGIGTLVGLAFYQLAPKVYESKMIVSSDVLTFSICKALISDLEELRKEDNHEEMAKKLGMPLADAKNIVGIKLVPSIEKAEGLREQEKTLLSITIKSFDQLLFSKLQQPLIKFLETNDYALAREKEKRALYNGLIEKATHEINELEKLRDKFLVGELFKTASGGTIYFDPTEINSKIVGLTEVKLKNQNSLALVNNVQIIQGFTNFTKPTSPKLSISLVGGASLGVFFMLALIVSRGFKEMVRLANKPKNE
jgi:hypothetical protein